MPSFRIVTAAGAIALMAASSAVLAQEDNRIRKGEAIAPVPLDLAGKDSDLVFLGSYIVNAQGGCNDCHTAPPYALGGDPFQGQPEQISVDAYLCGGVPFGPVVSRDISPDADGLPAGLERPEFINLLRTGERANGELLQVMPWPVYGKMTRRDLRAVYAYLSAIPSCDAEPPPD
jgi:hypothetical protein